MSTLKPRIVIDPLTGKKKTLTPEMQWRLFEKGIILDGPFEPNDTDSSSPSTKSQQPDQHV